MLITYLGTKSHIPCSSGPLIIAVKVKAK